MASIEVHLEAPYHAVLPIQDWPKDDWETYETTLRLMRHLEGLSATFYVLGEVAVRYPDLVQLTYQEGHRIGSHGFWHRHGEREGDASDRLARRYLPECVGYRSPFWESTPRPGLGGGVFFRTLPYWLVKAEVERSGVLYLHPHDFFASPYGPARRRLFFCDPWQRLERLLREIEFYG